MRMPKSKYPTGSKSRSWKAKKGITPQKPYQGFKLTLWIIDNNLN